MEFMMLAADRKYSPKTEGGPLSSGEVLVSAHTISKRFCRNYRRSLFYGARDIIGELLRSPFNPCQLREYEFWALSDVSFELRRGEALGIVGRNGSGKTTLLRILSGLINPTSGSIQKRGRLAPLLALGAGFNPLLTGEENIYANMALLGLTKAEIDARFDDVVDFAEIRESLDSAVQNYSSGMVARLGFACAVHTSPDVLLIDEVMAVGDAAFREKCATRIMELRNAGTSFIIINHAPQLIVDTCQRAIYLKDGCCAKEGEAIDVIRQYEEDLRLSSVKRPRAPKPSTGDEMPTRATHEARIASCVWSAVHGGKAVVAGEPASLVIEAEVDNPQKAASFMLRIEPAVGMQNLHWKEDRSAKAQAASVLVASNTQDGFPIAALTRGLSRVRVDFTPLCLTGGHYRFLIWLFAATDAKTPELLDLYTGYFDVQSNESMQGSNFYQPRRWSCPE
jgi:lipopolysaccharide transport system ATP-binding protein